MERVGEVVLLKELFALPTASPQIGKYVRVTGFITKFNPVINVCVISHDGFELLIDLAYIYNSTIVCDSLCQFIGEIRPFCEKVCSCQQFLFCSNQ